MRRRKILALSGLFALLLISPAIADDRTQSTSRSKFDTPAVEFDDPFNISLDIHDFPYEGAPTFLDTVTMHHSPPGSMKYRYRGPHQLAIKHARRHVRRVDREANKDLRRYMTAEESRQYEEQRDDAWRGLDLNGNWWDRSWMQSLTPEDGGAPRKPVVHTYGKDIDWTWGPITISNTLRLKIDYVAVFKFNPDADVQVDPERRPRIRSSSHVTVDVETHKPVSYGTSVKVDFQPVVRIGVPSLNDWLSTLKRVALRARASISYNGKTLIRIEGELRYSPDDLSLTIDVALTTW